MDFTETFTPEPQETRSARVRRVLLAAAHTARIPLMILGGLAIIAGIGMSVVYHRYGRMIDERLKAGIFPDSINLYASEMVVSAGDTVPSDELQAELHAMGYEESSNARPGTFYAAKNTLFVIPPAESPDPPVRIQFGAKQQVERIEVKGKAEKFWSAGYPLITNLSGREKRTMVRFRDIPPMLVNAVVSTEDKHFFQHRGIDVRRIAKAAYVDFQAGRKEEGASTVTMQLVRGLWLQPEKRWKRKFSEAAMTVYLEHKWSKEAIFEAYANQVYLGQQTSYSIHGFAQGAQMFFGKDLRDLTLPDAALLAGLVQRPSYFNPFRNPDRAEERRNLVLSLMRKNGYISEAEYQAATLSPLNLREREQPNRIQQTAYFVDRVNDEMQKDESSEEGPKDVYTSIDLNLQHAAREALASGMADVDKLLARSYGKSGVRAEAALIAIDPHTGEIKAMVGGRDYEKSQFNRVLAKRPPGSVFKPFVYAAALNTALTGGNQIFTPATTVDDSPISIRSGGTIYRPANFRNESFGTLTLRQALAHSDNIAAVKIAQAVGYGSVVAMARRAGLNNEIAATPSVALGSYAVTPLEMAGAYTVFANSGRWVKPRMIVNVRTANGVTAPGFQEESRQALDPRVAFLMVDLLQEVMRSGTAAGVRSRGFVLPAAGKTGTSHDGWFAGFTSQLLCIVWVGFDDYRELNLEGAKSALPIWTEFMKKASRLAAYRSAKAFPQPPGISSAKICGASGKLVGDSCDAVRNEDFISGSEPVEKCNSHAVEATVEVEGNGNATTVLTVSDSRAQ